MRVRANYLKFPFESEHESHSIPENIGKLPIPPERIRWPVARSQLAPGGYARRPDTNSTIDRWFPNSRSMRTCPESRPPLHQSLLTNHARCPHNPTPHGGPPSSLCTFSISLSSFNLRVSSGWSYFFLLKFGFKILSLFEKIISYFCYQFFISNIFLQ